MGRKTNAASSAQSKDYVPSGKPTARQGPPANTREWFENVQAAAKGEPEPHGGPIVVDHTD